VKSDRQGASALIVAIGFFLWLGILASLFWTLQLQYQTVWVSFDGSRLPGLPADGHLARVVHFVDPDCPCSRFSQPHIAKVEKQWGSDDIQFSSVNVAVADHGYVGLIPATPAVAVWDDAGDLAYFGPYTSGAICGEGEDLLGRFFNNRLAGQWINQEAVGCFCEQT